MKTLKSICIFIAFGVVFTPVVDHYLSGSTAWVMVSGYAVYMVAALVDSITK